ncbi:MAG: ATP-binding protein [Colwellia sp.]|nr:ATP-binding protein [Colwellia sp.]
MIKDKFHSLLKLPQINSLKFRLVVSAMAMTFIILPIIGLTLSNAFEKQIINSIKKELTAYSYSLLAVAEIDQQTLFMPEQLLENQFNVIQSGLYGVITKINDSSNNTILWHSNSLLSVNTPLIPSSPKVGQNSFSTFNFEQQKHFIFSLSVSFTSNKGDFELTVHVIKNTDDFETLVLEFQKQLSTWLLILMVLLFLVQGLWLIWTLRPLTKLSAEMIQIEQGQLDELKQSYPLELTQVTQQLNMLLRTERQQRKRYRNALSDLAHSLKTPLAVIQSQDELTQDSNEQLAIINQIIEHQLKRAQSAGESSWHIGVNVKETLDKLINTMKKIHHQKNLIFNCAVNKNLTFKGDEADLLEILGNLVDNASKAAKQQINISVSQSKQKLTLVIADDGIGIDKALQKSILKRGTRIDTYQQGHGIGLAIVRDLVESYQGQLNISNSTELGGAEFTVTI